MPTNVNQTFTSLMALKDEPLNQCSWFLIMQCSILFYQFSPDLYTTLKFHNPLCITPPLIRGGSHFMALLSQTLDLISSHLFIGSSQSKFVRFLTNPTLLPAVGQKIISVFLRKLHQTHMLGK